MTEIPDVHLLEREFETKDRPRVIYGFGAVERVAEACAGARRVLLVSDPGVKAAGHVDRVVASLKACGMEVASFCDVRENPTESDAARCSAAFHECQPDWVVAVGGGSAMDTAKAGNFLYTNGGRMRDYRGFHPHLKPLLPMVLIPTTAGTGSEAQSYALISEDDTHRKMACGTPTAAPNVAILDPELTLTCPATVTATAGLDALAHAIESFVCTRATPLSRQFAAAAFRLMAPAFPRVLRDPGDRRARAAMLLGAHWAGTAIEYSMLGAAHAAANPLTAHFGITHGTAVAIMLPHVVRFNRPVAGPAYGELLRWTDIRAADPAEALALQIEEWISAAGLPSQLRDLGVEQRDLPALAKEAALQWTGRFNPRPVNESDFVDLYRRAY